MVKPTVLMLRSQLPAVSADAVRVACGQVEVLLLTTGDGKANGDLEGVIPRVLVAGLGPGERRIPANVLGLMRRWASETSLLLLTEEPLTQPTVTLQRGRVTLLGAPAEPSRILRCLRTLLADDEPSRSHLSEVPPGAPRLEAQQKLGPGWWVSTLLDITAPTGTGALTVVADDRNCITSLVQLERAHLPPITPELARAIAKTLSSPSDTASKERHVSTMTGKKMGVVHLDSEGRRWSLYWPAGPGILRLASPRRLPHTWNVIESLERQRGRLLCLRAEPADLILAATTSPAVISRDEHPFLVQQTASEALLQGGPALVDWLFQQVTPLGFAAIAAEMR